MIPRRYFLLFDLLILAVAFLAVHYLRSALESFFALGWTFPQPLRDALTAPTSTSGQLPQLTDTVWIFVLMTPTMLIVLTFLGNHRSLLEQSLTQIVVGSLLGSLAGLSLVTLVLFALKHPEWSRLFIFSFALLGGVGLGLCRLILRRYFQFRRQAGHYAKNVLLIGLPASIEWMACYFSQHVPTTSRRLCGYLSVCPNQPAPDSGNDPNGVKLAQLEALGRVRDLGNLLISRPIHEVIAVQPVSGGDWLQDVIQTCDYLGILLRIVPEALLFGECKSLQTLYPFETLHLPAVVLVPPHFDSESLFFKRLFDVVVSAALLILLSPLFALIAIAIKLTTPHLPVLYPWHVVGQDGVEFTGYKFTTMCADADARKAELMSRNEMSGPVFKIKDDPRIVPLGRFLRKYSLNELPQLWSVLKGDMSLVGPRPAGPLELARYEFWHKRKLSIRPGITCLWQVHGRNKVSNFDEWVKMDLEYIDKWSLWLDFRILARTAWVVIAGTGS